MQPGSPNPERIPLGQQRDKDKLFIQNDTGFKGTPNAQTTAPNSSFNRAVERLQATQQSASRSLTVPRGIAVMLRMLHTCFTTSCQLLENIWENGSRKSSPLLGERIALASPGVK